LKIFQC